MSVAYSIMGSTDKRRPTIFLFLVDFQGFGTVEKRAGSHFQVSQ
jgi:hypothetical protein